MEWVALIVALVAVVLMGIHAGRARPWHLGWLGLCCLTISLIIWHVVAPLEPIIRNTN